MKAPIHATKHYVQKSLATVTASTGLDEVLVNAVEVQNVNTVSEVTEGAVIKAVYIELWCRSGEVTPGSYVFAIYKNPGTGTTFTTAQMAAMGTAENKKNVLFFSQGLVNDADADATPIFRGWVKIPKSKQRFGLGDRLLWSIFAQAAIDLHVCGFATYKEYQ